MEKFLQSADNLFVNGFWSALVVIAVVIAAAWALIQLLCRALKKLAARGRFDKTSIVYFRRIVKVVILLVAVMVILLQVKPLKGVAASVLASSGVLAVILGFAAQQAMANVVGGLFISVFKPVSLGDRIRLPEKDVEGYVEDISLRHTVIRTFGNARVIVPNSVMNGALIENFRYREEKDCRFVDVGVAYGADIERAMAIMAEEARAHKDFIDNRTEEEKRAGAPDVAVRVTKLGDSAVNLRAAVWTKDAGTGYAMECDLLLHIKKRFDAEGIEIPFPYRTVILKKEEK
jgi:small-conductance mechanosensitive channel